MIQLSKALPQTWTAMAMAKLTLMNSLNGSSNRKEVSNAAPGIRIVDIAKLSKFVT